MLITNTKKIYTYSNKAQWILAMTLLIIQILLLYFFFYNTPIYIWIIGFPVLKTMFFFSISPIMKLTGVFQYHSPMLLTIKWKEDKWEIHGGTVFDFFLNHKWRFRGEKSQKILMVQYLEGLLKLIEDVEKLGIKQKIELIGISYILGKKNAKKIGFIVEPINLKRRLMFIFDYFSLTLMYSFTRGKIAFPNVFKAIKLKIDSVKLIESKDYILRMVAMLKQRDKLLTKNI